MQINKELIAEAVASNKLQALAEPVARALLDGSSEVDDCLTDAEDSGIASITMVLGDLVDLACVHGDLEMQRLPSTKGWHTFGLAALIQSDQDHTLVSIHDSRQLARDLADVLGLDYASVRIGPYSPHSLSALGSSASDFAKTCATMRLEACKAMPPDVESFYGYNERGTVQTLLTKQVQLFVSVCASSHEDARQMAHEVNSWVMAQSRVSTLNYRFADGSGVDVSCTALMAGLPWTLRTKAAYEIQSLVLAEIAQQWFEDAGEPDSTRQFSVLCQFDSEATVTDITLLGWFSENPSSVRAARLGTSERGELLDLKLSQRLVDAGWLEAPLDPETCADLGEVVVNGSPLPVSWDHRFLP